MDEYIFEEGSSLPIITKPIYGGYRKRLIDKMVTNTPRTLYKLVKFPGNATATLNNRLEKVCDDHDTIIPVTKIQKVGFPEEQPDEIVRTEKIVYYPEKHGTVGPDIGVIKAYKNYGPEPDMNSGQNVPVLDINKIKAFHNDFLGPDIASTKTLQIWYPDKLRGASTIQYASRMSDLNNANSTKSAVLSLPFNLKLTDKHLAQMVPVVTARDTIWPPCWKSYEKLGSFVCVVDRIDEKNYEFKVMLMAGPYADDNDTLAKLMKLFNPMYHMELMNREATQEMSRTMVATAANEFFGPQIVESCIAVWVSCQRDLSINIKKCNTVFTMNNLKSNDFDFDFKMDDWKMDYTKMNVIKAKKVNNVKSTKSHLEPEEVPLPAEGPPPKKSNKHHPLKFETEEDNSVETLTRNTEVAQYLSEVFAKRNPIVYPADLRMFSTAAYSMLPIYDYVKEIHVNEDQLNQLMADFGTLKTYIPEEGRMKG